MRKIEYFCDICGKKVYEEGFKSFEYKGHPRINALDICHSCQHQLIVVALQRTDIVNPRRLCKTCEGKGYITVSDGCGPYPDRKTEPCPDCGKIIV